jgi:hypothetical protein
VELPSSAVCAALGVLLYLAFAVAFFFFSAQRFFMSSDNLLRPAAVKRPPRFALTRLAGAIVTLRSVAKMSLRGLCGLLLPGRDGPVLAKKLKDKVQRERAERCSRSARLACL